MTVCQSTVCDFISRNANMPDIHITCLSIYQTNTVNSPSINCQAVGVSVVNCQPVIMLYSLSVQQYPSPQFVNLSVCQAVILSVYNRCREMYQQYDMYTRRTRWRLLNHLAWFKKAQESTMALVFIDAIFRHCL